MGNLIVIEGDNGTGKDTLAQLLQKTGYDIVSYSEEAKKAERFARSCTGEERIIAFLDYNIICGSMSILSSKPSLLVRYWVSTLAAAYADNLWSWEKIENIIRKNNLRLPTPDVVLWIECSSIERSKRVVNRDSIRTNEGKSKLKDNMCIERENRYASVAKRLLSNFFPNWGSIDSSDLTQIEVFNHAIGILSKNGLSI